MESAAAAAAQRRPAAAATFLAEPHLMWRQIFTNFSQTTPSSWEETAFAEDAAGAAVWPPRSYTCNFCMRQFRSAQALGGHMNVHRRDRARLQTDPSRPFRAPRVCPIIKGGSFNINGDDDFYCVKNNKRSPASGFCGKRTKVCVSSSSLDQELDLELRLGC